MLLCRKWLSKLYVSASSLWLRFGLRRQVIPIRLSVKERFGLRLVELLRQCYCVFLALLHKSCDWARRCCDTESCATLDFTNCGYVYTVTEFAENRDFPTR